VSVIYEDGRPVAIDTVLISTQHAPGVDIESLLKPDLLEHVIHPLLPADLDTEFHPGAGQPDRPFELGGPHADTGLTGRKIIVDTYGGMARHGGGAFSGKDPSKVDRSAAYAARWVAKHVVASGAARRCEVQVAYAIGVAHPVSVMVETFGTEPSTRPSRSPRPSTRSSTSVRPPSSATSTCADPSTADRRLRPLRPDGQGASPGRRRPIARFDDLFLPRPTHWRWCWVPTSGVSRVRVPCSFWCRPNRGPVDCAVA
jgi:hypothetical protein